MWIDRIEIYRVDDGLFSAKAYETQNHRNSLYEFNESNLSMNGWADIPGGFGNASPGNIFFTNITNLLIPSTEDNLGMKIDVRNRQVAFVYFRYPIVIGNMPILMKLFVRASNENAQIALAALEGNLGNGNTDGSIATCVPFNSKSFVEKEGAIVLLYQPEVSDEVTPIIQIASINPIPVTVWIDRLEIYYINEPEYNTKVENNSVATTPSPTPIYVNNNEHVPIVSAYASVQSGTQIPIKTGDTIEANIGQSVVITFKNFDPNQYILFPEISVKLGPGFTREERVLDVREGSLDYELKINIPVNVDSSSMNIDIFYTVKDYLGQVTNAKYSIRISEIKPQEITIPLSGLPTDAVPLEMVLIKAGKFLMGSPEYEKDRWDDEGPQHWVTISNDFYMGKYEVTQEQWQAVMGFNPNIFGDENSAVAQVSWYDCQTFIDKLNRLGQGTFRMPTEAEWEYTCRAGSTTRFYWGDDIDYREIIEYAWYEGNSEYQKKVGTKLPNKYGLYDMSGNLMEWCQDWYDNYSSQDRFDPVGPNLGSYRVLRGGSWIDLARFCRSAQRIRGIPESRDSYGGLRLARTK